MIKSLISVLMALAILSWGLTGPAASQLKQDERGEGGLSQQNIETIDEQQSQQFDSVLPEDSVSPLQSIIPTPIPQKSVELPEYSPSLEDVGLQTMMTPMTNHMMQQISHGIWSGNYYNPMIP